MMQGTSDGTVIIIIIIIIVVALIVVVVVVIVLRGRWFEDRPHLMRGSSNIS